jgi:predicted transcriptional regulator
MRIQGVSVSKETITFRIEAEKREALDAIALMMDRDRSYVLNLAISAYLEVNQWQIEHIKEGLRQADPGEFPTEAEVAAAFENWRQ